MIKPITKTKTVPVDEALPSAWLRKSATRADDRERVGALLRVGPRETFRLALATAIDGAREVVLVASFLLSDRQVADAMLRAAGRGVRVYVLTASEARLATLVHEDDGFGQRMLEEHKALLNELAGHVLLRSAEHFHAKFLVVDPGQKPRGWLSTANFNKALQDNIELGVELSAPAAGELAAWFNWAFWSEAERELTGKGRLAQVSPAPAQPGRATSKRIVATAREEAGLRAAVLRLIRGARSRLVVVSYGLELAHAAVQAIEQRLAAGVPVTVLTRPRPAVGPTVTRLRELGASVQAHDKLHAKAIVSDAGAIVMTANLEAHGLDGGFEVGVLLQGREAADLESTLRDWSASFPWELGVSTPRAGHLGELCPVSDGLRDGIVEVIPEVAMDAGTVTAASALDLDAAPEPKLRPPKAGRRWPQRVVYTWVVQPPHLPKGAKEQQRMETRSTRGKDGEVKETEVKVSYDPPVYQHRGRRMVLLRTLEDEPRARRLADELNADVVLP